MMPRRLIGLLSVMSFLLAACASGPVPPDWQINVQGSTERAVAAYLTGRTRIEQAEFARSRAEIAQTGQADLMARLELVYCATRVASLVVEDCAGFARLVQDAGRAERAYADYLAGQVAAQDVALLPPSHRGAVSGGVQSLIAISDPLSRLVAAGVMFKLGRADPAVMALAVDTSSAQGWSRPLLAWLYLQAQRADLAGQTQEAGRLRRRIALVLQTPTRVP
jgi:hypothetical protein